MSTSRRCAELACGHEHRPCVVPMGASASSWQRWYALHRGVDLGLVPAQRRRWLEELAAEVYGTEEAGRLERAGERRLRLVEGCVAAAG